MERLQSVLADVVEIKARRELITDQFGSRLRQQNLVAAGQRHDPSSAVQDRAEVVAAPFLGLAGVQTRSNPDDCFVPRLIGEADLGSGDRGNCVGRGRECRSERIPGGREHVAVLKLDGPAHDLIVTGECRRHRPRVVLPQRRTALNIGEDERHGSAGRPGRHGPKLPASPVASGTGVLRWANETLHRFYTLSIQVRTLSFDRSTGVVCLFDDECVDEHDVTERAPGITAETPPAFPPSDPTHSITSIRTGIWGVPGALLQRQCALCGDSHFG